MKRILPFFNVSPLSRDPSALQALKEGSADAVPGGWRRRWPAFVLAAAIGALAAWRLTANSNRFPRRPSEFLSGGALERRLERTAQRLKDNPDDIRSMVESGVLLFQKGRDFYPDAINNLDDAWQRGALDPRIFYYLGVMYQDEGLYRDAIKHYLMFLRNRPKDTEVRLLLAKLLYQSGQYDDAVTEYRELQKRRSHDPLVTENLALSLKALKRYDEAKAQLQALSAMGVSENLRTHFHLGQIAADQGDSREAMRQYLALMPPESHPDVGIKPLEIYTAVAENYDKLNAPALAKEPWEQVLRLDPQNKRAKSRLRALNQLLEKKKKRSSRSRRR